MKLRVPLGIMLALLLTACGGKNAPEEPPAPQPTPCPFVYVYAPGNYIIDIAGGAEVVLDPMAQDFSLFCAPRTPGRLSTPKSRRAACPRAIGASTGWKASSTTLPRSPAPTSTCSSAWPPLWIG